MDNNKIYQMYRKVIANQPLPMDVHVAEPTENFRTYLTKEKFFELFNNDSEFSKRWKNKLDIQ